jgi:RNA polymerase sigma-70 factor (ECF subfamily)
MSKPSTSRSAAATDWSAANVELSQLLSRTALGDRAAFARLYERSSSQLFAVVLRIQRDRAQAEELLQEIYVAVWKAAGSFDVARAQPMTWLASIARNRAIDSLRRAGAQPQTVSGEAQDDEGEHDGHDGLLAQMPSDDPGPLELLEQASARRDLQQCMQRLSAAQRQSVAMAFFDGLSHGEVAQQLRQPLGTVKSWVRRGLQSLKDCLDHAVKREAAPGGPVGQV